MPQKHSTIRNSKHLVWYTERLWTASEDLIPFEIEVESVKELDKDCWFGPENEATLRRVAQHARRIHEASLEMPIILNDDGSLMDGGHRLCKAFIEGRKTIAAVQFASMPEPDEIHEIPD